MNRWICVFFLIIVWSSRPILSLAEEFPHRGGNDDKMPLPIIAFNWLADKSSFQAGDIANIKVKLLDDSFRDRYSDFSTDPLNFSLTVNGKKGNSSYISGVFQHLEDDPTFWNISFTTIRTGQFPLIIADDHFGIFDSSLHFTVTAGEIYPSACVITWMNFMTDFVAGTEVYLFLLLKDAFGNNVSSGIDGLGGDYFMVSLSNQNGSTAEALSVKHIGWNELGYFGIEFVPRTAGMFLLHVHGNNQSLIGSPLTFVVKPGSINITNSHGEWKYRTNMFQIFTKLEMLLYQKDQFGNLVPGFYPFDARVVERTSNLSIPIADLLFEEVTEGTQLLSFVVSKPGEFRLIIFDAKINESVWNMTYYFSVFIGYCNESNSFANGTGLTSAIAGRMSSFTVYLEDMYHNPSPLEAGRLRVEIFNENDTSTLMSLIYPLWNLAETSSINRMFNGSTTLFPASSKNDDKQIISGNSSTQTSGFNITYTPEKCGEYKVLVFCGNVPINDGNPHVLKVSPGLVDTSLSNVQRFTRSVRRCVKNEVVVQLMDSYQNPILAAQTKLNFQVFSVNSSNFMKWEFLDKGNGSYTGHYMAKDLGAYKICIFFEDKHLSPCPFEVHAYEKEYFSEAKDDTIFVWEDESLAFDVLSNDYIAGGRSTTIEFSKPIHGSLLHYGNLFRYTPYLGFFGSDSFSYTISDANKNIATAMVSISVLSKPPQFVSLPTGLHVIEDIISPKFGGFSGFEIMYSDINRNISLAIRAQSGNVYFSPIRMQLQQTLQRLFLVNRAGRARKEIIISGYVQTINSALQYVQYVGNVNFYGNDIITLHAMNEHGAQEARVPVFVEPINDPPTITAPKFISLTRKEGSNGLKIFDKQRDAFDFSIIDSDIFNFSGNKSHFIVILSMEVNDGTISTTLPVGLINAAELKIQDSNRWQPLQTFVTLSNHFVIQGKGIRFRGTISECNNGIQQLYYQGTGNDAVLTVTVNDLGNYGCYNDCLEMMSVPLYREITVNLIRRKPANRMEVFVLGSAIAVEMIMILLLGGVLLFFICKCLNALQRERTDSYVDATISSEGNMTNQTRSSE